MTEGFSRPTARLARALDVARLVHEGAVRKGTTVPYIEHPVAVARILEEHGYDEDLVVAGVLHDVVEDARYDSASFQQDMHRVAGVGRLPCPAEHRVFRAAFLGFLADEFGRRVFDLVMAVSESKNDGQPPLDWLERKREQLDRLAEASAETAALKAADALHNIDCTLRDVKRLGLGVLDRFRGGSLTVWHYSAIARLVVELMPEGDPLAARVCGAAHELGATVRALRPPPRGAERYPHPTVD